MKFARMKPESVKRVVAEAAEFFENPDITASACEDILSELESRAEAGETIKAEVTYNKRGEFGFYNKKIAFIRADESDFDFEEEED